MTIFQHHEVDGERVRVVALPDPSPKALAAFKRFVASDTIFGLDVETTAMEDMGAYDPSIKTRLIQFGSKSEAWVLDPAGPWRKWIIRLLARPDRRFCSHNASYDTTRVYFEFGIELGERSIDTLPLASLRHPGRTARKGLKELSDAYIDNKLSDAADLLHATFMDRFTAAKPRKNSLLPKTFEPGVSTCRKPRSKSEPVKCEQTSDPASLCGYCIDHFESRACTAEAMGWGFTNIAIDDPAFLAYAGLDAVYVRRLLDLLNSEVKRFRMSALSKTEQAVKRHMIDVSRRGHRVDVEWTAEVKAEVEAEFTAAEERVEIATGFKARSPHIRPWLTERGAKFKALDKDTLPDLALTYREDETLGPIFADLLVVSQQSNLLTNLRTIWRHATEGDGYTHSNINTQQAHTGRMSITDPAMQTFAKVGEKGRRLRGCYIAREGHVLVGADYDGQELRIGAALSGDPLMNRIIAEGLKQHNITAEAIFGKKYLGKDESPELYGAAKTLNFGQQYGLGPKKLALQLGVTYKEAYAMWLGWRESYAVFVEWSERMSRESHVRNPFGRVIPRDPWREYANANYTIQSTGRDVLGQALVRLADAGWADTFWLPVHDELVLEVPEDRADEAQDALTEHMSTTVPGTTMALPAQGELIGARWTGLG